MMIKAHQIKLHTTKSQDIFFRKSCGVSIHQATNEIIKKHSRIVIETLMPKNMLLNHRISQAIGDVSFGEITRQLTYKAQWNGKELIKADMWFASSKICSCCGNKKESLKLSERTYLCLNCGLSIDRDLNAAINLANYSPTLKYKESEACGVDSSSLETKSRFTEKHEIKFINLKH